MSIRTELLALNELQMLDSALDAVRKRFAGLDKGTGTQAVYEQAKAAHNEASAALKTVETDIRDTELEQQAVKTKRGTVETKLYSGKVTAPKELQAMQDEIAMLERQTEKADETLSGLMHTLETTRRHEADTKRTLAGATKAYRARLTEYQTLAETLGAQGRELKAQRTAQAAQIAPDLLKRYEALRISKGGVAIAPIIDGNACGRCKMGLPQFTLTQMRLVEDIVLCDHCGCILCPPIA